MAGTQSILKLRDLILKEMTLCSIDQRLKAPHKILKLQTVTSN